jgi:hypothetical protein
VYLFIFVFFQDSAWFLWCGGGLLAQANALDEFRATEGKRPRGNGTFRRTHFYFHTMFRVVICQFQPCPFLQA